MALGTIEHTPDTAAPSAEIQTSAQDRHIPDQEPPLPTPENWENERLHTSFDMPQYWEAPEPAQPQTLEQADHTETINQLSEIIRLQITDTQIGQLMIQLELLAMIERQNAVIAQLSIPQTIPAQNNS